MRRVALSLAVASFLAVALTSLPSAAASKGAQVQKSGKPPDTLVVRVVCADEIALKLLDPARRVAFSRPDSSGTEIPGCDLIRPYTYEDGTPWEDGTDDSAPDSSENEAPDSAEIEAQDTTAATWRPAPMAGNRGFRIRAPEFGTWRLEASLPSSVGTGIISADVWLNVRVKPRGSVLSDVDSRKSWVELRPGQRAHCLLILGRDGSLVRTRTRVTQIVAGPPRRGR